jgi:hypothetical protein
MLAPAMRHVEGLPIGNCRLPITGTFVAFEKSPIGNRQLEMK